MKKYSKEMLELAVSKSTSISGVVRFLGLRGKSGAQWKSIREAIARHGISVEHFKHVPAGGYKRSSPKEVFELKANYRQKASRLRWALIESGVPHKCAVCGLDGEWNSKPLTLEVDHIDGNWQNNEQSNLRFLCPNCHSQVPVYQRVAAKAQRLHLKKLEREFLKSSKPKKVWPTKIAWPPAEELEAMVNSLPIVEVGRRLGIGENAVRKRCKREGIDWPRRGQGYWGFTVRVKRVFNKPECGTLSSYRYGCRCDACMVTMRTYNREKRRAARGTDPARYRV